MWTEVESTYAGADIDANWDAMFQTIDLFRKAAIEGGEKLGCAYPADPDRRAAEYFEKVKNLDPDAKYFS